MKQDMIAVLDLGGQDNVQVARALREKGVYSEIHPHDIAPEALKALPGIRGFIVNGGENRVVNGVSIDVDPALYTLGLPFLVVNHRGSRPNDLDAWPLDMGPALQDFRCV